MENREIKFRAWDGKRMTTSGIMFNTSTGCVEVPKEGSFGSVLKTQFHLMQYTGLKDKNGKEIYEGDVVGGFPHGTVEVRWCVEYACFEAVWQEEEYDEAGIQITKERTSLFANELKDCADAWEVIGNIYENPELLK